MKYLYINKMAELSNLINNTTNPVLRGQLIHSLGCLSTNTSYYELTEKALENFSEQIKASAEDIHKKPAPLAAEFQEMRALSVQLNKLAMAQHKNNEENIRKIMARSFDNGETLDEFIAALKEFGKTALTTFDPTKISEAIIIASELNNKKKKAYKTADEVLNQNATFANKQLVCALVLRMVWLSYNEDLKNAYTLDQHAEKIISDLKKFYEEFPSMLTTH